MSQSHFREKSVCLLLQFLRCKSAHHCENSAEMSSSENTGGGDENERLPEIAGAIEYPGGRNATAFPNQPRQPANLQDLLRFSVEASTAGGQSVDSHEFVPGPMDAERRSFLEKVLKSMTIDVAEMLIKAIETLKGAASLDVGDDPTDCEEALDQLLDFVDNLDVANDFHKLGGLTVLGPCLSSPHAGLRWRAAQIVAELTQNNPYCQERVMEAKLLQPLMELLDSDPSDAVRVKALFAVSCLIRDCPAALAEFRSRDGFSVLLRALQSPIEKLQIKAAFLLSSLSQPDVKDELCVMGYVQQLVGLITAGPQPSLEHLLSALRALVSEHPPSQEECREPQLGLKETLRGLLGQCEGRPEYQEVCDHLQSLLSAVFSGEVDQDR